MKKHKDFDNAFPDIPVHLPENDVYKLEEQSFKAKLHHKSGDPLTEDDAQEEEQGRSIELY